MKVLHDALARPLSVAGVSRPLLEVRREPWPP
jgi:hypothetical protein